VSLPRTREELDKLLEPAVRTRVGELFTALASGGNAKQLQTEFVALLQPVFPSERPDQLYRLWSEFSRPSKPPVEPLETLLGRLTYPLGMTAGEWFREWKRAEEGEGTGRLPFLLCRVSGVAVRLAAAIAVRALVETKSKDAALNALVHKKLQAPSDGGWLELAREVSKAAAKHPWGGFLWQSLNAEHAPTFQGWVPARGGAGKQKTAVALNDLVAFRNKLVHGEAPDAAGLQKGCAQLEIALRGLGWLADHALRVKWKGREWAIEGAAPRTVGDGETLLGADVAEGEVFLVDPSGARPPLSLAPLLVFRPRGADDVTVETDELWFLNAGQLERLNYIGYRTTAVADGKGLESYEAFKKMMEALETPPIPADPRFDFTDLARFHERLFVGRTDVLDEVAEFVRGRPAPWGALTALPGMGKSAIMAMLYKRHVLGELPAGQSATGDTWVFHFCSAVDGRNSPTAALRSLVAQLCDVAKLERKDWLSTDLEELRDKRLPALVHKVAEGLPAGKKLVLAVDALDEGFGAEKDPVASAFVFRMPDNAVGLLTWRVPSAKEKNERVEQALRQFVGPDLRKALATASPLAGLQRPDVELLLRRLGEERGSTPSEGVVEATWKAATQDSGGAGADPFFLRLVADGVWSGEVRLDRAETVPQSLDDAFEALWMGLPRDREFLAHRVLVYLAILREPGTDALLAELIQRERPKEKVTADDIAALRLHAGKLLVYEGERYRLFHDRFKRFLVGEEKDPIAEALEAAGA
jgi:hypothetical protein